MLAVAPLRGSGSEHLTRAMRSLEAAFLIGVEGVTEVWLVRHADCYRDMVEIDDPPLSAFGREQARRLAERVRRANPAAGYSSPYRRAMENARAITDVMQLEPGRLRMLPYYTSISTVRALGDRRMVGALGDTAHLE